MISWKVRQSVCGLAELPAKSGAGVTHLLSILDPGFSEVEHFELGPHARLTLYFDDILSPRPGLMTPDASHVAALLTFGRNLPDNDPVHLLVHCHAGISRSTAAMAALLAQANPEADERAVMSHLAHIRPQAWPNLLMVSLADKYLGRRGRLIEAVGSLYARQIMATPGIAQEMTRYGRGAEVRLGRSSLPLEIGDAVP
ncbi:MAG TPA: protein-tyrosine-phosphatase [Chloroflexota bacterium]|nr:protein-tyrosine-phosphatase [Chloroflexota bacterium]